MRDKFEVYTDGACFPNPGFGGWAFIEKLENNEPGLCGSGIDSETTCNRMEYTAAIKAIEAFKYEGKPIFIYSDSQLLVNTCMIWMWTWAKNGWKKPLKNRDLVLVLYDLCCKHKITFNWVKGHSGNKFNELADDLANSAAVRGIENL